MKRYVIILVLLMAFYPFIGGQKGCMKGSGEIGVPGEEGAGEELLVDTAAGIEGETEGGIAPEECPEPPVKRVPACVALMPEANGGFVYDYARLDEAIKGMEGLGENFRKNLTKAVDPMELIESVENVDSVCISCHYRSSVELGTIKHQAYIAGHPFHTWPALMQVYGTCGKVLVIYSFKEGKENLLAEKFADVSSEDGIYTFPDSTIRAAQSGNNVLFGTPDFLSSGLANASSPSETFLSKNIEFYLPAGILFYTTRDIIPVIQAKGISNLLQMYTIVMPAQTLAFGDQADSILTSIDVFEKEIKLSAGIYGAEKEAFALASSSFDIKAYPLLYQSSYTLFQKVQAMIQAEAEGPQEF
jgi:hypothetical protein